MTGNAAPEAPAARHQPPMRGQQANALPRDEADAEQDRIEIPAFLRRQAN